MSDHHEDHDHGFSHVMSPGILLGTFGVLIVMTIVTVLLAGSPLIPKGFDVHVALTIATVKAAFVMLFFMHMIYDKPLNTIFFLFSIVFVSLFLGFAMTDTDQYQHRIDEYNYSEVEATP
ncbi:MAG TPA: cytochrome oxidase subunit IV [Planctomycetaceae bacterium]|mgnify:FL=1|nr:cytochrome oxidase subunit IV [Planctomycetaceae bacterium]